MNTRPTKGFSLVELLAVVLVLAVLAAVAVPLYIGTRKSSAARACKANEAIIASSEAAFALRNGQYNLVPSTNYVNGAPLTGGLIGAPEGLSSTVTCPLDGSAYTICKDAAGTAAAAGDEKKQLYIHCPNDATHKTDISAADTTPWNRGMAAVPTDNLP